MQLWTNNNGYRFNSLAIHYLSQAQTYADRVSEVAGCKQDGERCAEVTNIFQFGAIRPFLEM